MSRHEVVQLAWSIYSGHTSTPVSMLGWRLGLLADSVGQPGDSATCIELLQAAFLAAWSHACQQAQNHPARTNVGQHVTIAHENAYLVSPGPVVSPNVMSEVVETLSYGHVRETTEHACVSSIVFLSI